MSDYTPVWTPGTAITSTASAAITGGQVVAVSGNGTTAPAASASAAKVVGVAAFDAASGSRYSLHGRGQVHESTAAGAITAGDQVIAGSVAGTVSTLAVASAAAASDVNAARSVLGVALTTASDTALVQWMAF
jgi:hypothetical protein